MKSARIGWEVVDVVYTGIRDIDVEDIRRVVPRGEELLQVNLSTAKEQQLRFLRATKWGNLLLGFPSCSWWYPEPLQFHRSLSTVHFLEVV